MATVMGVNVNVSNTSSSANGGYWDSVTNYPYPSGVVTWQGNATWPDDTRDRIATLETEIRKVTLDMYRLLDVIRELGRADCVDGVDAGCGKCLPCRAQLAMLNEYESAVKALKSDGE